MNILAHPRTLFRLGILNLVRVIWYRLGLKIGMNSAVKLQGSYGDDNVFFIQKGQSDLPSRVGWIEWEEAFGIKGESISGAPPSWCRNLISGRYCRDDVPWHQIADFSADVGDIKGVWETSRFDWVVSLAQRAANGQTYFGWRLNRWLRDWCDKNPPYMGPNWKCGQEASIRLMHLLLAAHILGQKNEARDGLIKIVEVHLRRVFATLSYAIAQDNNHGTSEAAALFMGGAWLARMGRCDGGKYRKAGRKWLENRARYLIMEDGTFSQYSINYHRVMLDTYSWVELWRRFMDEPPFSETLYERLREAADWLANMVSSGSGDVPNLGANDGTRLIPLTDTDYRDFRPSVQLATVVFHESAAYGEVGKYDLVLAWLGLDKPERKRDVRASRDYPQGGFAVMRKGSAMGVLRYPVFRFRPSQSDLLHLDLWCHGINLLRDAGTYSYNSGGPCQDYFSSVKAHNTIQFDDRDQMPRLGRFLYGAWPKTENKTTIHHQDGYFICQAGYRDWLGAEHRREVRLDDSSIFVTDIISGFKSHATLRWRLCPGEWRLNADGVTSVEGRVVIAAQGAEVSLQLVEGLESRYYSKKIPIPVLEATVNRPCTITSEINFSS